MCKVTALILTRNEEANLDECLRSLDWVQERLVVDSYSTDRTLEIAETHGARMLQRAFTSHADQKNWAIPQAAHPWILSVDADERATPALRDEILQLLQEDPVCNGYFIYRRNFFFGREILHCGWERDKVIRLFHRDRCRFKPSAVHEEIDIGGPAGTMRGKLIHCTYRSFDHFLQKLDQYTTWAAQDLAEAGERAGVINLCLRPMLRFLKTYVYRFGFLDGLPGLILSGMAAFYVFLKYAKLWHKQLNDKSR